MDWLYDLVTSGSVFNVQIQAYRTPAFDLFFRLITILGNEEFYLLALPFFYWVVHKDFGRKLAYIFIASTYLNIFLKGLFALPRPFQVDDRVVPLVEEISYGLPSGHAQIPITVWGYALWSWRRLSRWFALLIVFVALVSFSRLYLGVHFPIDVLSGMTVGLLTLLGWIYYQPALGRWVSRLSDQQQLGLGIVVPLILLVIAGADPIGYPASDTANITGVFLGMNLGFYYEMRRLHFTSEGRWTQRGLRYLLGMVMVLLIWGGLRTLFGLVELPYLVEMGLRFIRYSVTGCAVAWWAPAAFVRLGLADREDRRKES